MKAISLRQPWAHAVLHLGKRVENRDWAGCGFRGPVLLHASSRGSFDPETGHARRGCDDPIWRPTPTLPLGGIVGRARIVDVIDLARGQPLVPTMRFGRANPAPEAWYAGGFALVIADVEPLPFIPWKGSLGFFDVPDEIVRRAMVST